MSVISAKGSVLPGYLFLRGCGDLDRYLDSLIRREVGHKMETGLKNPNK